MRIDELLNSTVPIKWTVLDMDHHIQVTFTISEKEYKVDFWQDGPRDCWVCDFYLVDDEGGGDWSLTKTGNEFKVFSTVSEAILKFIDKFWPKRLQFNADKKEGRISVYQKLLRKINPQLDKLGFHTRLLQKDPEYGTFVIDQN